MSNSNVYCETLLRTHKPLNKDIVAVLKQSNMSNFLQKIFNQISLQRDEKLWMSSDDGLTSERLQLLAEFPETQFAPQLKLDCIANAKNAKLSTGLREKGKGFNLA